MSQRLDILEHLESGNTITPMEALKRFGCYRLSGRIKELREQGCNIKTTMIAVKKADGKTGHVARYSMEVEKCSGL